MKLTRSARLLALVALGLVATIQTAPAEQSGPQQDTDHDRICRELKDAYDTNMAYYNGNPAKRAKWKIAALNLKTLADGNNCSWAAARGGAGGLDIGPTEDLDVAPPSGKTRVPSRALEGGLVKLN